MTTVEFNKGRERAILPEYFFIKSFLRQTDTGAEFIIDQRIDENLNQVISSAY
jgi:hypothetical protein